MGNVFVIGSINNDIVATAERHPSPGETLHGSALHLYPGGKGANQAVAASLAGARASMVGCVGDDDAGKRLIAFLSESGVETMHIKKVDTVSTGTALITVAGGENTIVVIAGANEQLGQDALDDVTIAGDDVIVAQYETPVATTVQAFKLAKQAGASTILNPAPAGDVNEELLNLTDYLVLNEHEFGVVFGQPVSIAITDEGYKPSFGGALIITLGSEGALLITANGRFLQPGVKVDAIDSTGAGDCFVGYLAAGLASGDMLRETLAIANAASALSVTRHGAAASIPKRSEIQV